MNPTASSGQNDATSSTSTPDALGRRDALRKLAVGGAIVWAAPVITSSVPAAAAVSTLPPTCTNYTVDWDDTTRFGASGSTFTSTTYSTPAITFSLSTSFFGGTSALGTNTQILDGPRGGISERAIRFEQTPVNGGGQVIRWTWSKQVRNVSFRIMDIDNRTGNNWSDRIVINTAGYTTSSPSPSTVNGAGTGADPFKNTQTNINLPNTSSEGNVLVNWAGPLFFVEFQFLCSNVGANGTNQLIDINDISFCR